LGNLPFRFKSLKRFELAYKGYLMFALFKNPAFKISDVMP